MDIDNNDINNIIKNTNFTELESTDYELLSPDIENNINLTLKKKFSKILKIIIKPLNLSINIIMN